MKKTLLPFLVLAAAVSARADGHSDFTITAADKTQIIDDRYPEVKPTREELRLHQRHGRVVCIRGVKSREAADYYRSLGVERFIDADPALWERPKNSIDRAIDEVRRLDLAAEDAWFALKDESAFEARRRKLRADMIAAIGGFPERTPLNVKTTGVFARKGCRIEKVMFESEPNHHVTAYLFLPDGAAKAPYPAVLVPLGHTNDGKLHKAYFKGGVVAAQAGLAALVYDPIDEGERPQIAGTRLNCVEGHVRTGLRASLVGWHGARFRIWDGIRALDYLESRPDIDGAKLAIMGHSGGGTLTSYIAALDTRVKSSCPACFVTTARDLVEFWGPQDCEQNIPGAMKLGLNHLSLMMMASPRPVELILAENDMFSPAGSFTTLAKMRELYARLGIPERVDYAIAMGRRHGWYDCSREASVRWIRRWLTGTDAPAPKVADEDALPPAESEADAFVVPGGMVSSLPGERGTYDIIRSRADALAARRPPLTRELVAKVSGIDVAHPCAEKEDVNCVRNGYWSFNKTPADELACIYDWLGTSIVRRRAERMIAEARAYAAARGGARMKLVAKGHEAIAAAHAHYLAPELFDGLEISDPPPSWRAVIDDPNLPLSPQDVVTGAFAAYDWTDLTGK